MASSVWRRNLSEITEWEMPVTASKKRGKIYERNSRGYGSIMLNEELMDILNQDSGVRETLSNLVRFTSTSNFVFQEQNATSSKIQNSKTRYNYS
jgi:hypothetical protein